MKESDWMILKVSFCLWRPAMLWNKVPPPPPLFSLTFWYCGHRPSIFISFHVPGSEYHFWLTVGVIEFVLSQNLITSSKRSINPLINYLLISPPTWLWDRQAAFGAQSFGNWLILQGAQPLLKGIWVLVNGFLFKYLFLRSQDCCWETFYVCTGFSR